MEDIERLVKTTLGEIEKVLGSKTVVGEPITIDGTTLIPLLSVGFGFGAGGGGSNKSDSKSNDGMGEGTGGAAGVKPIAMIVIDKDGVRIEPIKTGVASALDKFTEKMPDLMEKFMNKWAEKEKNKEG
ncbi:MAG TPA: sporulation protein YtfJ [Dehalococcoidia bacterium]|nr:sporulation protein YtfJ [Dehalococcoidia bacterium]